MLRSTRTVVQSLALVVTALLCAHCSKPYFGEDDDLFSPNARTTDALPAGDEDAPLDPANNTPADADKSEPEQRTDGACTHECDTEGEKRCSATSNSGTEVCKRASDGCRKWTNGADCAADYACDKAKNDGTCKAGCANDSGCSAANVNSARCTSDGKTELTCTKSGACYVWKTTRTNVLQECTSPTYCGPTTGRRMSCVVSAAGVCTQHDAVYNDCPSGTEQKTCQSLFRAN